MYVHNEEILFDAVIAFKSTVSLSLSIHKGTRIVILKVQRILQNITQ